MSNLDPIVINKSGVSVAGTTLRGVTRWAARHEPDRGVFEVQLTLVTSKFQADLDEGDRLVGPPAGAYPIAAREYARVAANTLVEKQLAAEVSQ